MIRLLAVLLTWFLYVETGRVVIENGDAFMEPPRRAYQWDQTGGTKDGGEGACQEARLALEKMSVRAWCQSEDGENDEW